MNKLRRLRSLSPEMAETLRLAGVQGIFWAAMAVGNYQTVYLQSIGFPATDFGLLNAIACAVAIFAMTFWGTVSDRIGSVRKIVILTLTLGCGLFIFVPLIPTGQSYSTLLFLILIPIINFFRVPMSPFVDNLTVRNCAEHRLNYGMVRSSGSFICHCRCYHGKRAHSCGGCAFDVLGDGHCDDSCHCSDVFLL